MIGLTNEHAGELRAALLEAAQTADATPLERDQYGARYVIDFMVRPFGGHGYHPSRRELCEADKLLRTWLPRVSMKSSVLPRVSLTRPLSCAWPTIIHS